ncbi:hypothetical protein F3J44_18325 [Pantoea sp. Tr-811]|uniref:hypothetical protein n=1 Tax=Pantoea sp. Tr-811 TaxID=2608361 RepID=UPI00141F54B2|nr:hypothetical protein [Pantoea sp. Tr-811]NIF28327.1 hypothetical protein [Pantoea sp. Tr-811]
MTLEVDVSNEQNAKPGWILTWGVVRTEPSVFVEALPSKEAAESKAASLGDGYKASYLSHIPGTDDFIIEADPQG